MSTHAITSINQVQHIPYVDHTVGRGKAEIETITTYDDGSSKITSVEFQFATYDNKGKDNSANVSKGANVNIKA